MKKKTVNGYLCCGTGDAAKYLRTNAKGIQNLIDAGELEVEINGRLNSSRIYIHIQSLIEVKYNEM